jgi:hypothetical protein
MILHGKACSSNGDVQWLFGFYKERSFFSMQGIFQLVADHNVSLSRLGYGVLGESKLLEKIYKPKRQITLEKSDWEPQIIVVCR